MKCHFRHLMRHTHTYTNTHIHKHARARGLALVWEVRCLMGSVARCPSPQCCIDRICSLVPSSRPKPPLSLPLEPISFLSSSAASGLWKPWSFHLPVRTVLLPFLTYPRCSSSPGLGSGPQCCMGSRSASEAEQGSWCSRRELLS